MKFKRIISILSLSAFLLISCSDDENTLDNPAIENPGDSSGNGSNATVLSTWVPSNLQLIQIIPLQTIEYPHQTGCEQDYLEILSNNTGKYYSHQENTCQVQIEDQAFTKNGNQVTINLSGFTIQGTLVETSNQMIITSDADEYLPFIEVMYPEAADYLTLLQGATLKLTLNRK